MMECKGWVTGLVNVERTSLNGWIARRTEAA